jgi:peroxiredoxin
MNSSNRWYLVFVAVLVLGGAWLWWSRVPVDAADDELAAQPAVGRLAPDFTLETLDGETFRLGDHLGKTPIVLNYWATWCGPCRREIPVLQAAHEHYEGDILFLGVDQGEDPAVVQAYVDEMGMTFTIPMDAEQAAAERYNIHGLPTTFFIDRDGIIRVVWSGEMNSVTLAENIAKITP